MIIYKQVLLQQQQSSQAILRATDTATQFYNFGNRKDDLPPTEPSDILLLLYP